LKGNSKSENKPSAVNRQPSAVSKGKSNAKDKSKSEMHRFFAFKNQRLRSE
jgi:hypothetical protein